MFATSTFRRTEDNNNNKIMVAMSGGVDSAACATMLGRAGFDVCGAVIRFSAASDGCVTAAESACRTLGIPLVVIDAREDFEREVVTPFCAAYCSGRTPSPCVMCNPRVKFARLLRAADEAGCAKIATGHYARVEGQNGGFVLRSAICTPRDQSYMLYALGQQVLSRLVLPLGSVESKADMRALASEAGLECAKTPDSQEICFIPDGDYAAFIHARNLHGAEGHFIAPDGTDIGPHLGVENYTVGQRRGLNVALGKPVFVREICPGGDIKLAFSGGEYSAAITVGNLVLNPCYDAQNLPPLTVKIRSAAKKAPCTLKIEPDGTALITFDTPARAPASGQAAVLYDGEYVVGGGEIARCMPTE